MTNNGQFKKGQKPWNAGKAKTIFCKICSTSFKKTPNRGKIYCSVKCRTNDPEYTRKASKNLIFNSIGFTKEIRKKLSDVKKGKLPPYMNDPEKKRVAILKMSMSKKDVVSPNKGKRFPSNSEEKNKNWKGDSVSYRSLHKWVRKYKKSINQCMFCGITSLNRSHMANVDHQYRRDVEDYIELCPKCHSHYDRQMKGNYVQS